VLDGRGEALNFGGQVIKNVAGFDAFRLMAGAQGLLGAILEVSLRASPAPRATTSRSLELPWPEASALIGALMRRPLPLTGTVHAGTRLHLRFAGGEGAVAAIAAEVGGEETTPKLWNGLRKMRLGPLAAPRLWRISIPRTAELADLDGEMLRDWGGAQIWLAGGEDADAVHAAAKAAGGHASLIRGAREGEAVFSPLPAPLLALHRRLKAALDPKGVFNPGRMYEDL
ncbi:MAG: FAD-linked oxidase C-terminal domain-containing protein, partial [Caulobacteraceae bacterium]